MKPTGQATGTFSAKETLRMIFALAGGIAGNIAGGRGPEGMEAGYNLIDAAKAAVSPAPKYPEPGTKAATKI